MKKWFLASRLRNTENLSLLAELQKPSGRLLVKWILAYINAKDERVKWQTMINHEENWQVNIPFYLIF